MKIRIHIILVLLVSVVIGCDQPQESAIKIDNILVSTGEFDQAFSQSRFSQQGQAGREMFLKEYISKKLILQEAERLGLDKNPEFLSDVQMFWEQGLIKMVTKHQQRELRNSIKISESQIREYYQKYSDRFQGKSFENVRNEIEQLIYAQQNLNSMRNWIDSLEQQSNIQINHQLLGISPQ